MVNRLLMWGTRPAIIDRHGLVKGVELKSHQDPGQFPLFFPNAFSYKYATMSKWDS